MPGKVQGGLDPREEPPSGSRAVTVEVAPGMSVTVLEAADADAVLASALDRGADPYAAIVWPAAIAAAQRLAGRVHAGDRVLDLGAGTGLCALTAARLGARATALDHDPAALSLLEAAAALQELRVEIRRFDLAGPERLPPADLVVLADVLYERPLALVAAGRALEALRHGAGVLVSDPDRVGRTEFVGHLAAAGVPVSFEEVTVTVPGESAPARVGVAWIALDSR